MTGLGAILLGATIIVGGWGVKEVNTNIEEQKNNKATLYDDYDWKYDNMTVCTNKYEGTEQGKKVVIKTYNDGSKYYYKEGTEISFTDGTTGETEYFEFVKECEDYIDKVMFLKNN